MIRVLVITGLIAGLFPAWGHAFVEASCRIVGAAVAATGGGDLAVGALVVVVLIYATVRAR